jgi:hypothetical protein
MRPVPKIQKSGELGVGLQDHVPAVSSVAAVGAAAGNKLFAAKADAAVSSVAPLDEDFCLIDEFDGSNPRRGAWAQTGRTRKSGRNACFLGRVNADALPFLVQPLELDNSGDLGKQGAVLADADILSGVDFGPVLADQDGPGLDQLAPVPLYAEALPGAVAPVSRTSLPLFMGHENLPKSSKQSMKIQILNFAVLLNADFVDPHGGEGLAMPLALVVPFPPFHLENDDLFRPALVQNLPHHLDVGQIGGAYQDLLAFGVIQNVGDLDPIPSLAEDFFHPQGVSGRNLVLLSPCLDDGVHGSPPDAKKMSVCVAHFGERLNSRI